MTINVAADGSLALPFRSTLPCDVSFCPAYLSYTDIAPGKTSIVINDPSGTKATVQFGRQLSRSVGPRNKTAHATTTLKAGQLTVWVTIAKNQTARLVLVVEPSPYATTTTSTSTPDSSPPQLQHVVVSLVGGDGGDAGTMVVSPNPSHAGPTDVVLVDNRDNKIGTPQLFLDVQPGLGNIALGTPGQHVTTVLCPHDWIAYVSFPSGTGPTTTTMFLGHGYGVHTTWSVDGTDPVDCTTPIT